MKCKQAKIGRKIEAIENRMKKNPHDSSSTLSATKMMISCFVADNLKYLVVACI